MRRRVTADPKDIARVELVKIINKTIAYHVRQDPISEDEKSALWHWSIPKPVLEALELAHEAGYITKQTCRTDKVTFVVPQWKTAVRWYSPTAMPFLLTPRGIHAMPARRYGSLDVRHIELSELADVLGAEQTDKLFEWACMAKELAIQCAEAKETVTKVFGMVKTVGQLNRMVPEFAQYLPEMQKLLLINQMRKSPYPDGWAEFDKSKIERALVVIARGHLVKTLTEGYPSAIGDNFSWAQAIPNA